MAKVIFVFICALIIYLSVLTPLNALAATARQKAPKVSDLGGLSVTPTIGGYLSNGSGSLSSSLLYGVKLGYDKFGTSIFDSLGVEGTVNFLTTTAQTDNSKASGYLFRLDAIYPFLFSKKTTPFLAIGLGGINTSTAAHSELRPLLNYGAGLKYFLEDYLALRVDVRHLLVYSNVNTHNNFEASVGLSYYFGKEPKKKPALLPAPKPPVKEIPKPETKPAEIIPVPLPLPVPETPEAPAAATKIISLDGNAQVRSLSPSGDTSSPQGKAEVTLTPGTMIVAQSGQALPAPVPASLAELQKAREAELVENELQSLRVLTVEFDVNLSKVKPGYDQQLKDIADLMKAYPGSIAKIEGHTDSTGKKNFNVRLSRNRAKSVRKTLIKFGVTSARIAVFGYGSSQSIADNLTDQGRQKNRRAVTTVTVLVPPPDMDLLTPPSKPDGGAAAKPPLAKARTTEVLAATAPAMTAEQEVGTVVELRGKVIIERGRSRMTARKKSRILAGDIIITTAKSRVKLQFNDQSTLTLGEKSRLVVKDFIKRKETDGSSLFNLLDGIGERQPMGG